MTYLSFFDASTDPYYDYVPLFLRMDGSSGSTTFIDSSKYARAMTAVGNAQHSTANGNFTGSTGLFDGVGDRVSCASAAELQIRTSAFVIEVEADLDGVGTEYTVVAKTENVGLVTYEWAGAIHGDYAVFYYGIRGNSQAQIRLFWPTVLSTGTKYHLAFGRRANGDWFSYKNGVIGTDYQVAPLAAVLAFGARTAGTYNDGVDLGDNTLQVTVGGTWGFWDASADYKYVRLTLAERYTGTSFTPPTTY